MFRFYANKRVFFKLHNSRHGNYWTGGKYWTGPCTDGQTVSLALPLIVTY